MFSSRYARVGPCVDPRRVESRIIGEMVRRYDSYCPRVGYPEVTFVDPYGKFFFAILDSIAEYKPKFSECWNEADGSVDERYFSLKPVMLPTLRLIYVVPHHRGRGIQQTLLEEMKNVADEVGESFAVFADPFRLNGVGREVSALQSLAKLERYGYSNAEDYLFRVHKQRQRFLRSGFRNVLYDNATVTGPWQSFVYVHAGASANELALFDELEVFYRCPRYESAEAS